MSRQVPAAVIGLLGAGSIAEPYLKSLSLCEGFKVEAVASRSGDSAKALAAKHGLRALEVADLIADPQINLIVNATPAAVHASLTGACLRTGKHVYSEKPLAASVAGADALIALADRSGLMLACAPAVTLWPPLRTAALMAARGDLGALVGGFASLIYPGPEIFHANPQHLYGLGAGPLFDMGVYGLTALIEILGQVEAVQAMGSQVTTRRQIRSGPRAGDAFFAETPTTIVAQMRHRTGALSSVQFGFEAMGSRAPGLEIYGTRASLSLPRPYARDGEVWISEAPGTWRAAPLEGPPWREADWAIGVTSAWTAFHERQPFATNARRAETLALMCAIEAQCEQSNREHDDAHSQPSAEI